VSIESFIALNTASATPDTTGSRKVTVQLLSGADELTVVLVTVGATATGAADGAVVGAAVAVPVGAEMGAVEAAGRDGEGVT
jgi:hypothetical protein